MNFRIYGADVIVSCKHFVKGKGKVHLTTGHEGPEGE
jgi:hypothetical protein